jgi:environmental stress-induced protein Ves
MLLDGDGVQLEGDGVQHRLNVPHEPFAFSGDMPLACTLLGTESRDFNVMARRASGTAEVRVLAALETLGACRHGVLMALQGSCEVACEDSAPGGALQFAPGQGIWWAGSPPRWRVRPIEPQACCVSVHWRPRDGCG